MNGFGIPKNEPYYIKIPKASKYTKLDEYKVTHAMIDYVCSNFAYKNKFCAENAWCEFINYGDTELVYVMDFEGKKFTLLFGQPATKIGTVKKEAGLLSHFAKLDPETVVAPLDFYKTKAYMFDHSFERECFITPYHMQTRCVASIYSGFGVYVPEPKYHFELFSEKERHIVCACMVAKLISLYDEKNKCGISACKLGGGDFMLEKDWNRENITASDTLKNLKLIACREVLNCSLEQYIEILRSELGKITYYSTENERDPNILINHKNRATMNEADINAGIALGLKLRKMARENNSQKESNAKPQKSSKNAKNPNGEGK